MDGEKNAVVAVKIAKCYWTLSFSDQAIKWLKKAINANSVMMEAYVLMAEYYSEQYDFLQRGKNPSNSYLESYPEAMNCIGEKRTWP